MWRLGWALILGIPLIVKALQSPLYYFGADEDDELFVRMAKGFLTGHWSSRWEVTGVVTMSKPVGFPLFLAGAHFLPWSPIITEYGIYLLGASLIAWSWWRISGSRAQATVILAALTFQPTWFSAMSLRIYRDSLTNALATLAIGLAFVVAARIRTRAGNAASPDQGMPTEAVTTRPRRSAGRLHLAVVYLITFATGVTFGLVVITKPTWQWLVVAVAAPLAVPLVRLVRRAQHRLSAGLAVATGAVVLIAGAYGVVATTKAMNSRTYHVALVEDLASGSFARAWSAWASVEAGPRRPDVAITESMRTAVYDVSPAAARLGPYLESPADPWKKADCNSPLRICDDSGPWFEWDLRFAAGNVPGVRSVQDLQAYFTKVADEIEGACNSHRLQCSSSPVLAPGLPTLDQIPTGEVASYAASGLWSMVWVDLPMDPQQGLAATPAQYTYWKSVVPGMSSFATVMNGTTPAWVSSLLRTITTLFAVGNIALLALLVSGPVIWLVRRIRRRRSAVGVDWSTATTSFLFFISASMGMFVLAVFAAAVGGLGFTSEGYWSDFATPAQLCLVLGAFASWPVLRGGSIRTGSVGGRVRSNSAVDPDGGRTVLVTAADAATVGT